MTSASSAKANAWQKIKNFLPLYLLLLPTVGSLLVFSYYPKMDVILMAFFRWEPPTVQEFIGLSNFRDAFSDPQFWASFRLVGILFAANLLKMWPAIIAAIALHRLASNRLRYFFQVSFVVPMIIPHIVVLLIWKSFYEPDYGIFNRFLNATGLMHVLDALDTAMPQLSEQLQPLLQTAIYPIFGSLFGLAFFGGCLIAFRHWMGEFGGKRLALLWLVPLAGLLPVAQALGLLTNGYGILTVIVVAIALFYALSRQLPTSWVIWMFFLIGGAIIFVGHWRHLPILMGFALLAVWLIDRRWSGFTAKGIAFNLGLGVLIIAAILHVLGCIWVTNTGQFENGNPAWLGNQSLVIPALLFWGFPWIGAVGVLIYLAGLQNITQDVYEAARLDGIGPIGLLFYIELPLILTQVRINLIFMTIGVMTTYQNFLLLLGPDGGPGNKGMVPGLYIFNAAFSEGKFGYGCALGLIMFVIILSLTVVYQRYFKISK